MSFSPEYVHSRVARVMPCLQNLQWENWLSSPQRKKPSVEREFGTIVERSYLGQRVQYWITTEVGRQQIVELNPHFIREPSDEKVVLYARRDDVVILKP